MSPVIAYVGRKTSFNGKYGFQWGVFRMAGTVRTTKYYFSYGSSFRDWEVSVTWRPDVTKRAWKKSEQ